MVSRSYILTSAVRAYRRWGNAVSMAFLRALSCPVGVPVGTWEAEPVRDPDMEWCFANHGSPMDGRR